jgi:hypothetical protein
MRVAGRRLTTLGMVVYAVIDWIVIMAPSLAVKLAAQRGGMGSNEGLDLVVASAVIATPHAVIAARRLRVEQRTAVRRLDTWIASIDALVVLALATTALVLTVLLGFAEEHALLANRGFPIVVLWVGLQLAAVGLAELVGRVVFWWLEPHEARAARRATREATRQATREATRRATRQAEPGA